MGRRIKPQTRFGSLALCNRPLAAAVWTLKGNRKMALNYNNEHCRIAAEMLGTEADLLDYRLIEYLNSCALLVNGGGGSLVSRQAIAVAIVAWREGKADNFTK